MKKGKRIASLVLAALMAATMTAPVLAAPASAQQESDATITIENPTYGKDYTLYRVFDATVSGANIAYTVIADSSDFNTDGTYKHVDDFNRNGYFRVDTAGNINVLAAAIDNDSKLPALTGGRLSDGAIGWITKSGNSYVERIAEISKLEETSSGTTSSGANYKVENGKLIFSSLPYGYYYVSSTVGSHVTVTSVKPDQIIVDKNQGPKWDPDPDPNPTPDPDNPDGPGKNIRIVENPGTAQEKIKLVNTNSMNFGETATFQLDIDATNYNGERQIEKYYVYDTLPEGFTLNKNSINIKVNDTEIAKNSNWRNIENPSETDRFILEIDWVDAAKKSKYPTNSDIQITYQATLNDKAVIGSAGNKNKAKFAWSYVEKDNDPEPDPEFDPKNPSKEQSSEEVSTTTYTYALAVKKIDVNGNPLETAQFEVTKQGSGDPLMLYESAGTVTDGNGSTSTPVKQYTTTNPEGSTNQATTKIESPASGIILIKGLAEGTYSIKETRAPAGYNKLTAPVTVQARLIEAQKETTTITTTVYKDKDGKVVATETEKVTEETVKSETADYKITPVLVRNVAGTLLPSTGGMGTTLFYIVGGLMVIGAAVLLITKKRMSSKN